MAAKRSRLDAQPTIELPTQVRRDEEGSEPGGWSQFFDAMLTWVDDEEAATHRATRDRHTGRPV